jgi:RNA polymerase sigma factor (sigma-70 family)
VDYPNTYDSYLSEISSSRYENLDAVKERELLVQSAAGSERAFTKLVETNLRLVIYIVNREFASKYGSAINVMDLIQEGNIGLMKGLRRFNPEKYNNRVAAYCWHYVRMNIGQFIAKELEDPDVCFSLLEPIDLEGYHPDFADAEVEYALDIKLADEIIATFTSILTPKEKRVLILFFGLESPFEARTLQEIGTMLHVSYNRAQKIKSIALQKLQEDGHLEKLLKPESTL